MYMVKIILLVDTYIQWVFVCCMYIFSMQVCICVNLCNKCACVYVFCMQVCMHVRAYVNLLMLHNLCIAGRY